MKPFKFDPDRWFKTKYERYFVTKNGKVRGPGCSKHGEKRGRILKQYLRGGVGDYKTVAVYISTRTPKNIPVHILMAETFLGPRISGMTVNHKDGNKLNNHRKNLEYATRKENSRHAAKMGLLTMGERHRSSKLKEADLPFIINNPSKLSVRQLANRFGVSWQTIRDVQLGITWKNYTKAALERVRGMMK